MIVFASFGIWAVAKVQIKMNDRKSHTFIGSVFSLEDTIAALDFQTVTVECNFEKGPLSLRI